MTDYPELDEIIEKLSSEVVDSAILTHSTGDLDAGQRVMLKAQKEAAHSIRALMIRERTKELNKLADYHLTQAGHKYLTKRYEELEHLSATEPKKGKVE